MPALFNRLGLYLSRYSIVTLRVCTCGPGVSNTKLLVLDPWSTVAYKVGPPWIGLPQGCLIELNLWEFETWSNSWGLYPSSWPRVGFVPLQVFTFNFWDTHRHPVIHWGLCLVSKAVWGKGSKRNVPTSVPLEADLVKLALFKNKTYICYSAKHFFSPIHKRAHLSLINLWIWAQRYQDHSQSVESLQAGITWVYLWKMTHFQRQALWWHRIRGHLLKIWSWCLTRPIYAYMHHYEQLLMLAMKLDSCWHSIFFLWHLLVQLSLSSLSPLRHPPPSQGLYCDIRQLVQFIKEAHGNVFRRVALSALLDSAEKVATTKKPEDKEETKQPGPRRYWSQWHHVQLQLVKWCAAAGIEFLLNLHG